MLLEDSGIDNFDAGMFSLQPEITFRMIILDPARVRMFTLLLTNLHRQKMSEFLQEPREIKNGDIFAFPEEKGHEQS